MTGADDDDAPRALLIGGSGFAGRCLARRLSDRYSVIATGRNHDIRDRAAMAALVETARPQVVVNLAAVTTVRAAMDDPATAQAVAVQGIETLLRALGAQGFEGRVLQISSSEVYGHPAPEDLPLTEASPCAPRNPYAQAKLDAEAVCGAWGGRMDIVIARPFTHIGPGQGDGFAVANWALQLARIAAGLQPPRIAVGALDTTRDLTDVRDVVRAYDGLLGGGRSGAVYNVCSGRETAMSQVLDELIALSGLEVQICVDPARLRSSEQTRLRGDHGRISAETGWFPELSLARTLSDMLQDAKGRVRQGARTA